MQRVLQYSTSCRCWIETNSKTPLLGLLHKIRYFTYLIL